MIIKIEENDLLKVRTIAEKTWPVAFGKILSKAQLDYMLNWMYSLENLKQQNADGHEFYLYQKNNEALGFMGIEPNYQDKNQIKIHKLYILPEHQGKKIGAHFIRFAEKRASELNQDSISLNVNRFNDAKFFYEKNGFIITQSIDIEIGQGYLMEDFVMEKQLKILE
jgi:diamine N-acetyltransferase